MKNLVLLAFAFLVVACGKEVTDVTPENFRAGRNMVNMDPSYQAMMQGNQNAAMAAMQANQDAAKAAMQANQSPAPSTMPMPPPTAPADPFVTDPRYEQMAMPILTVGSNSIPYVKNGPTPTIFIHDFMSTPVVWGGMGVFNCTYTFYRDGNSEYSLTGQPSNGALGFTRTETLNFAIDGDGSSRTLEVSCNALGGGIKKVSAIVKSIPVSTTFAISHFGGMRTTYSYSFWDPIIVGSLSWTTVGTSSDSKCFLSGPGRSNKEVPINGTEKLKLDADRETAVEIVYTLKCTNGLQVKEATPLRFSKIYSLLPY